MPMPSSALYVARIMAWLLLAAGVVILLAVSCDLAQAKGRHRPRPYVGAGGGYCAPVFTEDAGMFKICAPTPPRRRR